MSSACYFLEQNDSCSNFIQEYSTSISLKERESSVTFKQLKTLELKCNLDIYLTCYTHEFSLKILTSGYFPVADLDFEATASCKK